MARACRRFLGLDCHDLGHVRRDLRVPEAIRRQMPYLDRSPGGPAAADQQKVARHLVELTEKAR
jgi:hypothetical protein